MSVPLKVLFLDDEVELCEIFRDFFTSAEVDVDTFSVPQQAIEATLKKKYDLIFLDYRLPGITGDVVAQKMPPDVPKYMITGELGANPTYAFKHIFQKPFEPELIRKVIEAAKSAN